MLLVIVERVVISITEQNTAGAQGNCPTPYHHVFAYVPAIAVVLPAIMVCGGMQSGWQIDTIIYWAGKVLM